MSSQRLVLGVKGRPQLRLSTSSGRITVTAEERSDILIEAGAPARDAIEVDSAGQVTLTSAKGGSAHLKVRCPTGTNVVAGTVSGTVELRGELGQAHVTTVSGKIDVEGAEGLDVRTVSGSIEAGRCVGRCRLQTKSGRATVGSAGEVDVSTISGRIRLGDITGHVQVRTASGKVEVGTQGKGDVTVETMSGAVVVKVPPGLRPTARLKSASGEARCDCEEGADCRVAVRSISGKIEVIPG